MSTEINLGDATAAAQLHKLTKKQLQSKDAEIERLEEIVAGESDSSLSVAYEDGRQEAEKEYKHRAEKAEAENKQLKVELNTAQQIQLTTEGFLNDAEAEVQALEMDAIKAKGETIDERLKR